MAHRVAVLGATGYSGRELIQLIYQHPQLELGAAVCRSDGGKRLSHLMPGAPAQLLTSFDQLELDTYETVFLCLPHGTSAEWGERALRAGCRVIDLSADFRLRSPEVYARTYGLEHPCPGRLETAVYGLTEWTREQLPSTRLIANPGCYPTSVLLGVTPLLRAGLLRSGCLVADCKSGASGAGRGAAVTNLFSEVSENVRPYQVGDKHRHRAEMLQQLGAYVPDLKLAFVPQVVPCHRGMLANLYLDIELDPAEIRHLYQEFSDSEPFIELLPEGESASMAHSRQSNRCVISLHPLPDCGKLVVLSSIDNLLKGAAGQALQNLNVAMGWPETQGLPLCGY